MKTDINTSKLFRVEDKTAENDNAPIPLCKFCSKPMIRLPKTDKIGTGYACDCENFQSYILKDLEVQNCKKTIESVEHKIAIMEQEMFDLGREADYYKLVENAVLKNMNSKNKTKKEKIVSFKEVKNNKDMVDETKSLTEKYYFYPYIT